jgi:hypothetical protein
VTSRGVLRATFYVYFAFLGSVIATAVLLYPWIQTGASPENLLGVGQGIVGWSAFLVVLAILVVPQLQKFNQPISLRKWIPLCLAATVLGILAFVWIFSATVCVVCL